MPVGAFVSVAYGTFSSAGSTTVVTPAQNHTAGNLLLAVCAHTVNAAPTSVVDTAGNTYTALTNFDSGGGRSDLYYATNITGNASNVITFTFSSSVANRQASVCEYSGELTTPIDVSIGGTYASGSTSFTSATFTTAAADEMIVAINNDDDGGTVTFTAGNIGGVASTLRGSPVDRHAFEDLLVSSTQTNITAAMSWTPAHNGEYHVVSFKTGSAGGRTPKNTRHTELGVDTGQDMWGHL